MQRGKRFHSHNAYTYGDGYWTYLQSYDTAVVKVDPYTNKILVTKYYDYSSSTRKQVCRFLNEYAVGFYRVQHWGIATLRELVNSGVIKTIDKSFGQGW